MSKFEKVVCALLAGIAAILLCSLFGCGTRDYHDRIYSPVTGKLVRDVHINFNEAAYDVKAGVIFLKIPQGGWLFIYKPESKVDKATVSAVGNLATAALNISRLFVGVP